MGRANNKRAHLKQLEEAREAKAREAKEEPKFHAKKQSKPSGGWASEARREGCNVPFLRHGCLLGAPIPAGASKVPLGAVRMQCRNAECPAVPWLHEECYEELVEQLSEECLRSHSRCKAWSKRYAVENLWRQGRGYDLIYSLTKCPAVGCTGFLCRDDSFVAPPKPKAAPKAPKAQPLPVSTAGQPLTKAAAKAARPDLQKMLKSHGDTKSLFRCGAVKGTSASSVVAGAAYVASRAKDEATRVAHFASGAGGPPPPPTATSGLKRGGKKRAQWRPFDDTLDDEEELYTFPDSEEAAKPAPMPSQNAWAIRAAARDVPVAVQTPSPPPQTEPAFQTATASTAEAIRFLCKLEGAVGGAGGKLWEHSEALAELFGGISAQLMDQIAQAGDLANWLELSQAPVRMHRGFLVPESELVEETSLPEPIGPPKKTRPRLELKSIGVAKQGVGEGAWEVFCEAYGISLVCPAGLCAALRLRYGDWVSFLGVRAEVEEGAEGWVVEEAEVLQRAGAKDDDARLLADLASSDDEEQDQPSTTDHTTATHTTATNSQLNSPDSLSPKPDVAPPFRAHLLRQATQSPVTVVGDIGQGPLSYKPYDPFSSTPDIWGPGGYGERWGGEDVVRPFGSTSPPHGSLESPSPPLFSKDGPSPPPGLLSRAPAPLGGRVSLGRGLRGPSVPTPALPGLPHKVLGLGDGRTGAGAGLGALRNGPSLAGLGIHALAHIRANPTYDAVPARSASPHEGRGLPGLPAHLQRLHLLPQPPTYRFPTPRFPQHF